ncbi:MAG: heparan-alpha-glucosaminide N-acetyltransferase [Candidatus Aenigmatarchaeota archaeon]
MKRFWEIDFSRGVAIVLMIIFNYSFALKYLGVYTVDAGFAYWYAFPRIIASMFILISGISLTLMQSKKGFHKKMTMRGLKIFGLGMMITLLTFLTFPEAFIIFGILHLVGFSILFGQFFLKFRKLNIILGLLLIALGLYLQNFSFDFNWLLWLGFTPSNFTTFDYFPVLPWFGVSLIGIYLGNMLYRNGKRNFRIKDFSNNLAVKFISFIGRNSLTIYLLHQIVLIMVLLVLGFKVF